MTLRTSLDKLRLSKNAADHESIKRRNSAAKWLEAELVAQIDKLSPGFEPEMAFAAA